MTTMTQKKKEEINHCKEWKGEWIMMSMKFKKAKDYYF
jgi:hypothetical protein